MALSWNGKGLLMKQTKLGREGNDVQKINGIDLEWKWFGV
jgi:hypothetical protein